MGFIKHNTYSVITLAIDDDCAMNISRFYARPENEILGDLLNEAYKTTFHSSTVHPSFVNGLFDNALYLHQGTARDMRVPSACAITIDGQKGELHCNYYRLYLNRYISDAVVEESRGGSDADLLEALNERYGVLLRPGDVTIVRYGLKHPEDPTAGRCVITPKYGHLIWVGPLEVRLVPPNHLSLDVRRPLLGTLDLLSEPDIAQNILTPILGGFHLTDLAD